MNQLKHSCVVLADRNYPLVDGMRGLLEAVFENVVMVASVSTLLESTRRLHPNLVIADLSLSEDTGLDWMKELTRKCPETRLIALSVHDEHDVRQHAIESGCDGFVIKREIAGSLLQTVDQVLSPGSEPRP